MVYQTYRKSELNELAGFKVLHFIKNIVFIEMVKICLPILEK